MIIREPNGRTKPTTKEALAQWHKPVRALPLWAAGGAKATITKLGGVGGRIFDENGLFRGSEQNGEAYHGAGGSSDFYRLANPIADREESDRPYEENVWVRAGIKAISEGFQRTDFKILTGDPAADTTTEVEGHPLLTLLANPNRLLTERGLWRAHAVNMKHDGEEIWFLLDMDGKPVDADPITCTLNVMPASIVAVRGSLVDVKFDNAGMPASYRYTTSFSRSNSLVSPEFPASSVVHFRDYDPYNITRGLGDVDALERELDLYFQAFRAMDGAVRNGGEPGGFIIYDHEVAPEEMQRRQEQADEEYSGPNQRRMKLLQASAKYVPNTVKPSDMQYPELLAWLRDSILSGLGVPPPVVGIYDSATYNNVETAYRELWTGSNGILSLAANSADVMTNDLLRRMERVAPGSSNLVAHFDASKIPALREDVGERLDRAAEIAAKGIGVSFNESLVMQGVEVEQPGEGDRAWVAQGLNDLSDPETGKVAPPEPAPAAESDDEESNEDSTADGDEEGVTEQNVGGPLIAYRVEGEQDLDPTVAERVEAWIAAYEKEQITHLRRIVAPNSLLRKLSIFDEMFNPEALDEEAWDALLLSNEPWAERLARDVRVSLRSVYTAALAEAQAEAGGALISSTDPRVIEELAIQRIKLSEGVASVTQRRVRNAIARVLAGAAPPGSLREMIKAVLPELTEELRRVFGNKEARAATIAQTETGQAVNNAKIAQYEASDVETIQWIASSDEAVRATHLGVHGQIIPLGGLFDNGLRRPHDPNGRAAEVINCRCKIRVASRRDPLDDPDIEIS